MGLQPDYLDRYNQDGLFLVKNFFDEKTAESLAEIVDQLMEGERSLKGMFFQMDPNSPEFKELPFTDTHWSIPSLNYRKVKDLEFLPEFFEAIINSPARVFSKAIIGPNVSSMRTMIVNKPVGSVSPLPWHQDISSNWPMSALPEFTIWVALDDTGEENGCVEWVLGSHKKGAIEEGHTVNEASIESLIEEGEVLKGILPRGDAIVFNNAVVHRSLPNKSQNRRRGLTISLMNANITNTRTNKLYPKIFGEGALDLEMLNNLKEIPLELKANF